MRSAPQDLLTGEIFDDYAALSVDELSRLCAVDRTYIVQLVEEGVLSTIEVDTTEWRFAGAALRRTRTALRLQRDLDLNLPGVALVLQLLEELTQLRCRLDVVRG
jgi:chaperone modulatory protein CbpM